MKGARQRHSPIEGPLFFFSYSRKDAGPALDRFFRDLSARAGKTGFRDTASIEVGTRWSRSLDEALRTCQAFVAVYSPAYFESQNCGKEWTAFRSRYEERMVTDDEPPPLIIPVLWKGRGELSLPPAAQEVQYHQESLPDIYVEKGLLSLLQDPATEADYSRIVDTLAVKMAAAITGHELAPRRVRFDFAQISNAFVDDGTRAGRTERGLRERFEGYLRALWSRLKPLPLHQVSGRSAERESIPLSAVYTALKTTAELSLELGGEGLRPSAHSSLRLAPGYLSGLLERAIRTAEATDRSSFPEIWEPLSIRRSVTALEAAAGCQRLVLLGAPGSGKSTFARYLALSHAGQILGEREANLARLNRIDQRDKGEDGPFRPWPHGAQLPVFVQLADFVGSDSFPGQRKLAEAGNLVRYLGEREPEPSSQLVEMMQEAMRRKQGAVLILDGLDETPNAEDVRDRLRDIICSFTEQYPECRVLVTSRPYAYERESSWRLDTAGFENATLASLDEEAIQAFIQSWFGYQARKHVIDADKARAMADAMWSNLQTETHLRPLAERPLMLTMMADLHSSRGGSLRGGRAELYEKGSELLLDRWNERREGKTASEYLGMTPDQMRAALEELAYCVHKDRGAATPSEAVQITPGDIFEALGDYRPKSGVVDEREVIAYLHQRSGILLAESPRHYRFPHRSFQEYLAGCFLVRKRFPKLISEELRTDPTLWREVFLLAAAKVSPTPFMVWALLEELVPKAPPLNLADAESERFACALLAGMAVRENRLFEGTDEQDVEKLERVRLWLQGALEVGALTVLDRAEAGRILGVIGDKRRGVGLRADVVPAIDWVEVACGSFLMGSNETDTMADFDERPPRHLSLPAFRIARYPITNAQYRAFVTDGGYSERWRDCWLDAGWDWKGAREGPNDRLPDLYLLANHPRVNVSRFEAAAFCQWLGRKLGHDVRLPTEEEWEKAARGTDGRVFPWGDDFDAMRCNMASTGIDSPTAVGAFPEGTSPYGLFDACGNVWEWTASKWDPQSDATVSRVLRGGSFRDTERLVRCAFRQTDLSVNESVCGFRVCAPVQGDTGL